MTDEMALRILALDRFERIKEYAEHVANFDALAEAGILKGRVISQLRALSWWLDAQPRDSKAVDVLYRHVWLPAHQHLVHLHMDALESELGLESLLHL